MSADLYLIAPSDIGTTDLAGALGRALERPGIAALLLPLGNRDEATYHRLVRAVAPAAQDANIAVLIEGEPDWVRQLGADGLHVSGSVAAVRDAVARLKPDLIVGAGDIRSRHDAMQKGEAGADYILFGPLSGHIDAAQRELAEWWAETMEVPCVLADPSAATPVASRCEFKGIGLIAGEQSA